jgi:hypothetical protein
MRMARVLFSGLATELRGENHFWIPTTKMHEAWAATGGDDVDLVALLLDAQTQPLLDRGNADNDSDNSDDAHGDSDAGNAQHSPAMR